MKRKVPTYYYVQISRRNVYSEINTEINTQDIMRKLVTCKVKKEESTITVSLGTV